MTATKKVKSYKHDTKPASRLIERAVIVRESSANEATKSFTAVIASENPVERWDELRKEVVKEILLTSGLEFRDGRNQLPIVDSHDRTTTRNVLGSIRNIAVIGDEVVGVPMFARDTDSQDAFYKVLDGHITDFSITADPLEIYEVKRGQVADFQGKRIEGPANVVTRWQPTDASLVAAGADVRSKVRRSYELSKGIARAMTPEAIAQLVAKGMPSDLTDPDQIMAWVLGNLSASEASTAGVEMPEAPEVEMAAPVEDKPTEPAPEEEKPKEEMAMTRAIDTEEIKRSERKRITEIHTLCTKAGIERTVADTWANDGVSLDVVREKVIERMAANATQLGTSVGADVRVTESSDDKLYDAMRDGLITRSLSYTTLQNRRLSAPADGHQDFVHMPVRRMAAMIVRGEYGLSYQQMERLSEIEIMRLAMGNPAAIRRHRAFIRRDSAYHTTGNFGNLLLDAINKTLLSAYAEAQYSYTIWARQGASTSDLKSIHRMRFSEFPNLEMIPENAPYPNKAMSDSKESYRPEKRGAALSYSWEAFINDDLDALSKGSVMMGNAAQRTINQEVYQVLIANDLMGDGVALFGAHASGSNTSGSAAAPSVTTLNAGFLAMRKQKGLNSSVSINVTPRFLIHGPAYEATVDELLVSTSYNAANNNEGVKNLYGPEGPQKRRLIPVCDNALGDTSTDWFLAADQSQGVDTVEYTFLAGEETPQIDQMEDFDTDTYKFKIRQTFGVKAIDWRGLYRNKA